MGFLKNALTPPATKNRINQQQQQQSQYQYSGTSAAPPVNPSSYGYGAQHHPQYTAAAAATAYTTGTTTTAVATPTTAYPSYNAYGGGFPDNNAPVMATAYVPGTNPAYHNNTYNNLNSNNYNLNNNPNNNGNAEVNFWECPSCNYAKNVNSNTICGGCGTSMPPDMLECLAESSTTGGGYNPATTTSTTNHSQGGYYNNPTTPNNTQANIVNSINAGLNKLSTGGGTGAKLANSISTQMNKLNLGGVTGTTATNIGGGGTYGSNIGGGGGGSGGSGGGGVMRVHIPAGMNPGQQIKVRSPDGKEVVKTIPPQSEWQYDGARPYFRMQVGGGGDTPSSTSSYNPYANEHAPAAAPSYGITPPSHNNNTNSSGIMRVPIPSGMQPGQMIKVRSPNGAEVVKTIPPQSEWQYDGAKPFFRIQVGADNATSPSSYNPYGTNNISNPSSNTYSVPPHTTNWREFHCTAPSHYDPPPVALRSVSCIPRGMGSGLPPNGRHKALLIGINYKKTRAELRGCVNDAKSMQDLLKRNGYPDDGSHMLLLSDESSRGREYQPTTDNIMKAFKWFMNDVRKGDILFFHFSGHGGQVPDKTGHEIDGYNETIVPVDYSRSGQITDDVLWGSLVYNLPEGARLTALMDMCHR
jgi:hypothetical protein